MSSDDTDSEPTETGRQDDGSIVLPMRLYKGVTVFSTLLATALVVLGFFMFDAATHPANPLREGAVWLVGVSGWTPPSGAVDVAFGLVGVAIVLVGAGSYVLGTRFKAEGMVGDEESS